jgi:hypothetical protein
MDCLGMKRGWLNSLLAYHPPDHLTTFCDLRRCAEGARKVLLPFQKVAADWRLEIMNGVRSLPEGAEGRVQIASNP